MTWARQGGRSGTAGGRGGAGEGEPVDDGGCQAGVGERVAPLGERGVGGAGDGGLLLAFGDDLEEQFGAAGVEVHVADLVEAEQVEAGEAAHHAGELFVVGGLDELVDQGGGGDVSDPPAGFGGGGAQADEQVGLAGAGVPEQHDRLSGVDPGAGGQVRQGGRGQSGERGEVEVGQALAAGELGLQHPADAAAGVAVFALGGEHLGQVCLVGEPFPGGGLGDPGGLGAHGGQVQGAA